MSKRLSGKFALVSGAAKGIGLAAVRRLAESGAAIAAIDLPGADFTEAKKVVEGSGVPFLALEADVAECADWETCASTIADAFGGLDIIFNNAGISGPVSPLADYPLDAFDQVMRINCRGVFLGMKFGVRLIGPNGGSIINMSSVSGLGGGKNTFAYNASKHAVVGMTKVGAVELAPQGIRVNAICPAMTETDMMLGLEVGKSPDEIEAIRSHFTDMIPLARYAKPEEIADVVVYLASEESSFINGAAIPIDGGLKAQ